MARADAGAVGDFSSAAFAGFEQAMAITPEARFDVVLAGRRVRFRFAGAQLERRLSAAFRHVRDDAGAGAEADFTLGCWDRQATGVAPPSPPASWTAADYLSAGRIRGHMFGDLRASYDPWLRFLELYDRAEGRALFHVNCAADVPAWFDRSPFRTLLSWWAADQGMTMLHASSVTTDAGAAVLAGRSGAGKSTTAMACALGGLGFLGDDACLVQAQPHPWVQSVYRGSKLEPDAVRRLAGPLPEAAGRQGDQYLFDPEPPPATSVPLRVVLVVSVADDGATTVTRLRPPAALAVLLRSTLGELGGRGTQLLAPLAQLARTVPCLRLELGTGTAEVVAAVVAAIDAGG